MVATVRQILSSSSAGKYFYFTEKNFENASSWHDSQGIKFLDLPHLTKENFEEALDGKLAENVLSEGEERVTPIILGKKTSRGLEHNPGREIIFSAPKSVSIMGLIVCDSRVIEAHEKAVSEALDYYERNMVYTRVQKGGDMELERTGNMVAARFTHTSSRANKNGMEDAERIIDPQLHTHCLIMNATKCQDGKFRSIVFDKLHENKMHLGELYRMELAHGLKELGYQINLEKDKSSHWTFEIAGVPEKDIKEFSNRREKIMEVAAELNRYDQASLAMIAKMTREEKIKYSPEHLKSSWEKRISSLSLLKELVIECKTTQDIAEQHDIFALVKASVLDLSEKEAVFDREKIVERLIHYTGCDFMIKQIEEAIDIASSSGKLMKSYNKNLSSVTTPEHLKLEKQIIALMQSLIGSVRPIMNNDEILNSLSTKNLSSGQKDALTLILNTKDRVIGIQGSAGTGKTTVLKAVKESVATKSYEVIGLAPTKSAASTIKKETDIEAMTAHFFINKYAGVLAGRGTAVGRDSMRAEFNNKIVVLDEASLISSRQIKDLLALSKELRFRLVMLGDVKQLGAVEAGKPFYFLQNNGMNTVQIKAIQRQQSKELLKSVLLAEGAVDKEARSASAWISGALKNLRAENIIDLSKGHNDHKIKTNRELADALYERWCTIFASGKEALIVIPSNPLRLIVNKEIRKHYIKGPDTQAVILKNKGLSPDKLKNFQNYEVGDVLLFNRNINNNGVYKGDYLKVLNLDAREKSIELGSEDGRRNIKLIPSSLKLRGGDIEVFKEDSINIANGEKIRWTKNSKSYNFMINGDSAVIKQIYSDTATIKINDSREVKIPLKDLQHIDYDYSNTVYGAQGKTCDYVIGVCRAKERYIDLSTQRAFYVILSRARFGATLVTDNYEKLAWSLGLKSGAKSSAIEHQNSKYEKNYIALNSSDKRVFIAKNNIGSSAEEQAAPSKNIQENHTIKFEFQKRSYNELHRHFINNPSIIKTTACDAFGEINEKLSKYDNLRFGNKGHITVDLKSGMWYDFKSGEGGNLYKMFKDSSTFHNIKNDQNRLPLHQTTESKTKEQKLFAVSALYKNSISVLDKEGNLAKEYLQTHRRINLSKVHLSDDVRFIAKSYASETKSYHPALVSFARDVDGKVQASQMIFLDPKTADKNKNLEVVKRTFGVLKNSFVEVTKNIDSDIILVAEGLETALSLAEGVPEARVICSLGISNIRNISFAKEINKANKKIIICADNDGRASNTNLVIERAASTLKEQGVNSVSIIRPDAIGHDFNDVLKVDGAKEINGYIAPLIAKTKPLQAILIRLQSDIKQQKILEQDLHKTVCFDIYKDRRSALKNWHILVQEKGSEQAVKGIMKNPEILGGLHGISFFGLKTLGRIKALNAIQNDVKNLLNINSCQQTIKNKEKIFKDLQRTFIQKYLSGISKCYTKSLDISDIKEKISYDVLKALKAADGIIDFKAVQSVSTRIAEQIMHHRIRYNKEPDTSKKISFFSQARFEEMRRKDLNHELEAKLKPKTIGERIDFNQKLERLISIDSNHAINKENIFYSAAPIEQSIAILEANDKKIETLTKEQVSQGQNAVAAKFIATEMVKYEEKNAAYMPLKMSDRLNQISVYVKNNFNQLLKFGFSKEEAAIIYNEGANLLMHTAQNAETLNANQVKAVQEITRNELTVHAQNKPITINQSAQKAATTPVSKVNLEIEI